MVLVNREVEPGNWDEEGTLTLCRRTGDTWAVVKEVRLETARSLQGARLSRSGRLLAAAGPGNVVRVYTVPDLSERGQVRFPVSGANNLTVEGLDFSPDEGMLAVGTHAALPGLVRIPKDPGQPIAKISPWVGHGPTGSCRLDSRPTACACSRAATTRRCASGTLETLELEKRYALPDGFEAVAEEDAAGSPWILCAPEDWPGGTEPNGWPLKVVEAQSGEAFWIDPRLPEGFDPDRRETGMPDGTLLLVHSQTPADFAASTPPAASLVSTVATTDRVWRRGRAASRSDGRSLRIPARLGKGDVQGGIHAGGPAYRGGRGARGAEEPGFTRTTAGSSPASATSSPPGRSGSCTRRTRCTSSPVVRSRADGHCSASARMAIATPSASRRRPSRTGSFMDSRRHGGGRVGARDAFGEDALRRAARDGCGANPPRRGRGASRRRGRRRALTLDPATDVKGTGGANLAPPRHRTR